MMVGDATRDGIFLRKMSETIKRKSQPSSI